MMNMKPVIVNGEVIHGYYVCKDGNVWSAKRNAIKKLKPSVSGKSPYPKVTLSQHDRLLHLYVHRVVCESIHPFPIPDGVSDSEWRITPNTVKKLLRGSFQVNHIDHNHRNHHPSNLEWVSAKENSNKYQQYRLAN
jgi:hypothetical protein